MWNAYQSDWKKRNRTVVAKSEKVYRDRIVASRDGAGRATLIKTHGLVGSYTSGCRCEACCAANTAKSRRYYATPKGKEVREAIGRRSRTSLREWMRGIKQNSWCLDCGYVGPPEAMDFDHRDGEDKSDNVSALALRCVAKARIAAEIMKCDLVCANCHRIRTAQRRKEAVV